MQIPVYLEIELFNTWISRQSYSSRIRLSDVAKRKSLKALPVDDPDAKFIGMDCLEPHTLKPFFGYDFKEFKSAGNYFKTNQALYERRRTYLNNITAYEKNNCFIIYSCYL